MNDFIKKNWIVIVISIIAVFIISKQQIDTKKVETRLKKSTETVQLLETKASSFSDSIASLNRYYSNEMQKMRNSVVDSIVNETIRPDGTITRTITLKRTEKEYVTVVVKDTVLQKVEVIKKDTVTVTKLEKEIVKVDSSHIETITYQKSAFYIGAGYQANLDLKHGPFIETSYIKPMGIFFVSTGVNIPIYNIKDDTKISAQVGIKF